MEHTIYCPDCGGSGQVFADELIFIDEATDEVEDIKIPVRCPKCKGDGLIEVEEEDFT